MNRSPVLIVVRDFPPYFGTLGGVIRILKLADFLELRGIPVHVVASAGHELNYFGYEDVVKRLNIHYVPDKLQRYNTRQSTSPVASSSAPNKHPSFGKRIRNVVSELAVPDLGIFFFRGMYRAARAIIESHGIKNVIVSSPPFSTQAVGWLLKRQFGDKLNLIVDYRDSWNTLSIFAKHWPATRALNRFMERKVLESADHLLYQSPPVIEKINRMFPSAVKDSLLVMNGYDPVMAPRANMPNSKGDMLTIGHFGSINDDANGFRNPTPILRAAAELDLPIRFEFFGPTRLSSQWKERLGARFVIGENLAHDEALRKMAGTDVLMLVHSDPDGADEVIPAKIFEYMLTGRPIFAAGPANMESARMVQERTLGYTADILDPSAITKTLKRILADWENDRLVTYSRDLLSEFARPVQYEKILPLLA